jgi:hypothetical protein
MVCAYGLARKYKIKSCYVFWTHIFVLYVRCAVCIIFCGAGTLSSKFCCISREYIFVKLSTRVEVALKM